MCVYLNFCHPPFTLYLLAYSLFLSPPTPPPPLPPPNTESVSTSGGEDDDDGYRKKKKPRTAFSREQVGDLEKKFQEKKYLSSAERGELAEKLKLSDMQVYICIPIQANWLQWGCIPV